MLLLWCGVWYCGAVVLRGCAVVMLWCGGIVALWRCGALALWRCGAVEIVVLWCRGAAVG